MLGVSRGFTGHDPGGFARMEATLPVLTFLRAGMEVFRHPLTNGLRIGRAEGCTLRLPDPTISRFHLEVSEVKGRWTARPLGRAPLLHQGKGVDSHPLHPGDVLSIGTWQMRFDLEGPSLALDEHSTHRPRSKSGGGMAGMVGTGPSMQQVFQKIRTLASSSLPVLILGETGTGKEKVAWALHSLSHRSSQPLVAVNCAAISPTLFESELFGHRRGSFTGAVADHAGAFERAGSGTLFLDEIGEFPAEAQAKLLRVLETGEVMPVGGSRPVKVRARLVVATHRDLSADARSGRFRADLLFRLWVVPITLPPLRERTEDIPALAEWVLTENNPEHPLALTPAALARLRTHPWPGNVRELRNTLLRATVCGEAGWIDAPHLEFISPLEVPSPGVSPSLATTERLAITAALEKCGGNRTRAARFLGIARSTLHLKLRSLEMDPPLVTS